MHSNTYTKSIQSGKMIDMRRNRVIKAMNADNTKYNRTLTTSNNDESAFTYGYVKILNNRKKEEPNRFPTSTGKIGCHEFEDTGNEDDPNRKVRDKELREFQRTHEYWSRYYQQKGERNTQSCLTELRQINPYCKTSSTITGLRILSWMSMDKSFRKLDIDEQWKLQVSWKTDTASAAEIQQHAETKPQAAETQQHAETKPLAAAYPWRIENPDVVTNSDVSSLDCEPVPVGKYIPPGMRTADVESVPNVHNMNEFPSLGHAAEHAVKLDAPSFVLEPSLKGKHNSPSDNEMSRAIRISDWLNADTHRPRLNTKWDKHRLDVTWDKPRLDAKLVFDELRLDEKLVVDEPRLNAIVDSEPRLDAIVDSEPRLDAIVDSEPRLDAIAVTESRLDAIAVTESRLDALVDTEPRFGAIADTEPRLGASIDLAPAAVCVTKHDMPSHPAEPKRRKYVPPWKRDPDTKKKKKKKSSAPNVEESRLVEVLDEARLDAVVDLARLDAVVDEPRLDTVVGSVVDEPGLDAGVEAFADEPLHETRLDTVVQAVVAETRLDAVVEAVVDETILGTVVEAVMDVTRLDAIADSEPRLGFAPVAACVTKPDMPSHPAEPRRRKYVPPWKRDPDTKRKMKKKLSAPNVNEARLVEVLDEPRLDAVVDLPRLDAVVHEHRLDAVVESVVDEPRIDAVVESVVDEPLLDAVVEAIVGELRLEAVLDVTRLKEVVDIEPRLDAIADAEPRLDASFGLAPVVVCATKHDMPSHPAEPRRRKYVPPWKRDPDTKKKKKKKTSCPNVDEPRLIEVVDEPRSAEVVGALLLDALVSEPRLGAVADESWFDAVADQSWFDAQADEPRLDEPLLDALVSEPRLDAVEDESWFDAVSDELLTEPRFDELLTEPRFDELVTEPRLDELVTEPRLIELMTEPRLDTVADESWFDAVTGEGWSDAVANENWFDAVADEPRLHAVASQTRIDAVASVSNSLSLSPLVKLTSRKSRDMCGGGRASPRRRSLLSWRGNSRRLRADAQSCARSCEVKHSSTSGCGDNASVVAKDLHAIPLTNGIQAQSKNSTVCSIDAPFQRADAAEGPDRVVYIDHDAVLQDPLPDGAETSRNESNKLSQDSKVDSSRSSWFRGLFRWRRS